MELDAGIRKHKCATLAEAEMLAQAGAPDVLLAYNMVGPNCGRLARLIQKYPGCRFSVLADHPAGAKQLSDALAAAGASVDVLIDLDVGQHRTGIAPGPAAAALYESFARLPGLRPGGFHVYDGHNHQESFHERQEAALRGLEPVLALRDAVEKKGLPVPVRRRGRHADVHRLRPPRPARVWSAPPAPVSCTTTATARASPTWPASARRRCC